MSDLPDQLDPPDAPAATVIAVEAGAGSGAGAGAEHAHRALRKKRLKQSLFSSLITRPISFLLPLITVPLFLKYLGGKERYGLYESIGALAMYIGITNAGLTLGLINHLTECHVSGDREQARRY